MSINFQTGTWFCHAFEAGGGLLQFERRLAGKEKTIGRKLRSPGQRHAQDEIRPEAPKQEVDWVLS
jgi:hypothetical protein